MRTGHFSPASRNICSVSSIRPRSRIRLSDGLGRVAAAVGMTSTTPLMWQSAAAATAQSGLATWPAADLIGGGRTRRSATGGGDGCAESQRPAAVVGLTGGATTARVTNGRRFRGALVGGGE
ncbi:uncharacterized protein A4U43_C04F29660 [Asparagus officinalis]|uniref:Uncharacterized protein n=1 Tax=Asparagus officinalis TaxID=4686 RepID=A0A5P1F7D1_ASPOF|nr:uncharacterized protein A4U43_C04F29660 [Asparagus officinalis]